MSPEKTPPELPASTEDQASIDLVLDLADEVKPSNLPAVVFRLDFSVKGPFVGSGLNFHSSPVCYHGGIWGLIPKRSDEDLGRFRDTLARDTIRDKVWLAKTRNPQAGNTVCYIVVEGNQRVLIASALGLPVSFGVIPLTDPADPVKVLAEAREFALRSNYRDRQHFTDQNKSESIRRLYLDEAKHNFARAGAWVADIVGCSQPLVSKTLAKMVEAGEYQPAPMILTRTGALIRNSALTLQAKAKLVEPPVETPPEPDDDDEVDLDGLIDGTEPDDDEAIDGTEVDEAVPWLDKNDVWHNPDGSFANDEEVNSYVAAGLDGKRPEPAKVDKTNEPVKLGPIDGFRYKDATVKEWRVRLTLTHPIQDWPLYNGEPWFAVSDNQWYKAIPGGKVKIEGPYLDHHGRAVLTRPPQDPSAKPWKDEHGRWHNPDRTYTTIQDGRKLDAKLAKEQVQYYGPFSHWLDRFEESVGGIAALDAKLDGLTDDEVNNEVAQLAALLTIGKAEQPADEVPEPVKVERRNRRKQPANV